MTVTPRWKPVPALGGNRAFTAELGTVDVVVTFVGAPPAELTGEWEASDADGEVLLRDVDPALAGRPTAVQVYAALVSIADRLTPALAPGQVLEPGFEYKVVELVTSDEGQDVEHTEAILNAHAADGWRLVSVDNRLAYLERRQSA
jgi:hypothetical protein